MIETFQKYSGTGMLVSWFLVAWVYLLLQEKQKPRRILFVYMPASILLLFFNPLFYGIFVNYTEEAIYFRFLWILPVTTVIAYATISVCNQLKGRKKLVFGWITVVLILLSGKLVYRNPLFEKAENLYHVPWEVVEICDSIEVEGREVKAAFPREFLLYVRQYSSAVCMPYGREVFDFGNEFFLLLEKDVIDVEKMAEMSKKTMCHYIILHKDKELVGNPESFEYEIFGQVGDYIIYCDTSIYKGL